MLLLASTSICQVLFYIIRKNNFNITVTNLAKEGDMSIPNPVTTFEQAYEHYRKYDNLLAP